MVEYFGHMVSEISGVSKRKSQRMECMRDLWHICLLVEEESLSVREDVLRVRPVLENGIQKAPQRGLEACRELHNSNKQSQTPNKDSGPVHRNRRVVSNGGG